MTVEVGNILYGTGGLDVRKGVLTVGQAAEFMGISPRTLRRLLAARRIRFIKMGNLVRIYQPDLDKFMEGCVVEAA